MLELVVSEIGQAEGKEARGEIVIVAGAALDGVSGGTGRWRGVIGGVDDVGVQADFVALGYTGSFAGQVKGEQGGISASFAEAGVEQAAPEIGQAWVLQAIVGALLVRIADGHDGVARGGDFSS